jgi:hypothetical protein
MDEFPEVSVDALRRALLLALPALAVSAGADAQDAAKMQPRAFKVVLENDRIRVLEFNSKPGMGICGSGMHSHPPHLTVALSPAKVRIKLPNGETINPPENRIGDVFWSEAETHETENIGGRDVRALIIELKQA